MDPAAALDLRELEGLAFACIPGCGFCCTFPPEVSAREAGALRLRVQPLLLTHGGGRSHLRLQGGCGACTLLRARECTQYDLRPAHCRYFPFHVYFGETTEVYVNRTCRGVEARAGADLRAGFRESVLANAPDGALDEGAGEARGAHAEFRRRARRGGAWTDPAPVIDRIREDGGARLRDADWRAGLEAFEGADPTARPFHLDRDLRWLAFERAGDGVAIHEMREDGSLVPLETLTADLLAREPPADALAGLVPYFRRLLARGLFVGSAFDLVDERRYRIGVEEALEARAREVAGDLALRARILLALGFPDVPAEVERFYDSDFLDLPTIGGWL